MAKQLKLSNNKMILGVCAGVAEYFNLDTTLVRVITVVLAFFGFVGIGLYLILWLVLYLSQK